MFHPLSSTIPSPQLFTYPFCYEPHPLAVLAAHELQRFISQSGIISEEKGAGKMFGVLVVEHNDGKGAMRRGFLAAYSGLLGGRNDWEYFVPPVFDAQQPDGHFKQTEREITTLNHEIERLKTAPAYVALLDERRRSVAQWQEELCAFKKEMDEAKARRDARRRSGEPLSKEEAALMTRESQYMKAEMRRRRKSVEQLTRDLDSRLASLSAPIDALRSRRRRMSDDLQQWLFSSYHMLNARGEQRDLIDIFREYTGSLPPAGAGDCCAPKLLQYAYSHGLHPLCMAEFWWGDSPVGEIRHHLAYYPACRSKCLPILTHMLKGLSVEPNPLLATRTLAEPRVVYEDDQLVVVDKPAGMLSVPGKGGDGRYSDCAAPISVEEHVGRGKAAHRLDMDTSGLLVIARTERAYTALQRQFAGREVRKRYEALVEGMPAKAEGIISLPLIADITDRPRQRVDFQQGKPATTSYRVVASRDGLSLVSLTPHTGRTHQLRVHCAHPDGLNCPILGDPLYGKRRADRMYLHAAEISFRHPVTGEEMHFASPSGFSV